MSEKLLEKQKEKQERLSCLIENMKNAKPENREKILLETIEAVVEVNHAELIEEIVMQSERAKSDNEYRKKLNLRTLNEKEKVFYSKFIENSSRQSVTASQDVIYPETIVDMTQEYIRENSDLLSLTNTAPTGVSKWYVASSTGSYAWGKLTDALTEQIDTEFSELQYDFGKLYTLMIIPKAIRDLSLEFVDKYFIAVQAMNMTDGLEYGYLFGNKVDQPIGIFKKIKEVDTDGTALDKEVIETLTGFSPKDLAPIRQTLTHNGLRNVNELHLICNPLDEAQYIDPALYGEKFGGGYEMKSFIPIIKHVTSNCPQGTAALTIKGHYTYGVGKIESNEFKETKALEDANVLISKCYANGRATDDDVAVVFDPTKLQEYTQKVIQVQEPQAQVQAAAAKASIFKK